MTSVLLLGVAAVASCKRNVDSPTPVITISTQPTASMSFVEGNIPATAALSVVATVTQRAKLAYKWYSNTSASNEGGIAIDGAASADYNIPATLKAGDYYYFCEVSATNSAKSVRTTPVTVKITAKPVPVITVGTQPVAPEVLVEGNIPEDVALTVEASATEGAKLSWQWYTCNPETGEPLEAIKDATSASFTIPADLTAGEHHYICVISAERAASVHTDPVTVIVAKKSGGGSPIATDTSVQYEIPEMTVGERIADLDVSKAVSGGIQPYIWSSSGLPLGLTVNGKGVIQGAPTYPERAGTATITVTDSSDPAGTAKITVKYGEVKDAYTPPPAPTISISKQPVGLTLNPAAMPRMIELAVAAAASNGTKLAYSWFVNTIGADYQGEGVTDLSGKIEGAASEVLSAPGAELLSLAENLGISIAWFWCEISAEGLEAVKSDIVKVEIIPTVIEITRESEDVTIPHDKGGDSSGLSVEARLLWKDQPTEGILEYAWYYMYEGGKDPASAESGLYAWHRTSTRASSGAYSYEGFTPIKGSYEQFYVDSSAANRIWVNPWADPGVYRFYCEVSSAGAASKKSRVITVTVTAPPVTYITSVKLTSTTPKMGDTASATVTGKGVGETFTATLEWNPTIPAGGKFGASTVYTAKVTLVPEAGYAFDIVDVLSDLLLNELTPTVDPVFASNGSLYFEVEFPRTDAPEDILTAENFPDANFLAALKVLAADWGDKDGYLSAAEAAAVTSINVADKKISSIKGIAHFKGLTTFYCDKNSLEEIDVSENTALYFLSCHTNSLKMLDVSKNVNLIYLICSGNSISTLDVSNNPALTNINCSGNSISTLDISKNEKLTRLELYGNPGDGESKLRVTVWSGFTAPPQKFTVAAWDYTFPTGVKSILPVYIDPTAEPIASGDGWEIAADGTLTITSNAAMKNPPAWKPHKASVKYVDIKSDVTLISGNAFQDCTNMESVIIPASVSQVQSNVFDNCPALKTVTCLRETPPLLQKNNWVPSGATLFVPNGKKTEYEKPGGSFTQSWATMFTDIRELP